MLENILWLTVFVGTKGFLSAVSVTQRYSLC